MPDIVSRWWAAPANPPNTPILTLITHRFMPDLQSVKVVGRLARAKRSRLYHLMENESGAHTYQVEVAPPK